MQTRQNQLHEARRRQHVHANAVIEQTPKNTTVQLTPGPNFGPDISFDWGVVRKKHGMDISVSSDDNTLVVTVPGDIDVRIRHMKKEKSRSAGKIRVMLNYENGFHFIDIVVAKSVYMDAVRHNIVVETCKVPDEEMMHDPFDGMASMFSVGGLEELAHMFGFGRPMHEQSTASSGHHTSSNGNGHASTNGHHATSNGKSKKANGRNSRRKSPMHS